MNIYVSHATSPIGDLTITSTEEGICSLEFDDKEPKLPNSNYTVINDENQHIKLLKTQLEEYFDAERTEFQVPLDLIGTDFQKKVWQTLLEIPFGVTRTYKEQSINIGDLKAIRAVATANGANKIAILIPCHRVIGSDGSLTGYAGGLWRKQFLLNLESNQRSLF